MLNFGKIAGPGALTSTCSNSGFAIPSKFIGSQEWPRIWSGNQMKKRTFSPWCGNLRLAARSFGLRIVMRQVLVFNRGSATNDIEILSIVVFNAKLVQRVLQSEVQRELWSGNVQAVVKSSMVLLLSILLPATTLPPVNTIVIEFITTVSTVYLMNIPKHQAKRFQSATNMHTEWVTATGCQDAREAYEAAESDSFPWSEEANRHDLWCCSKLWS